MTTLVIYHGSCFDGFTSAWVFHRLMEVGNPDIGKVEYHPAKYGEPPPDVKGKSVYIVDFSYKRAVLEKMKEDAEKLWVLDHHKTAEEDLRGLSYCIFDMKRSGCGITWDHFAGGLSRPLIVQVNEDRDLWLFKLDITKPIMDYEATFPMTFKAWDQLNNEIELDLGGVIKKGEAITRYIENYSEKAIESATLWRLPSKVGISFRFVPIINIQYMNCSEHLSLMTKRFKEYPFVASFFLRGDGKWQWSLRSDKDGSNFDVSEIAKLQGGGGHRNAAGFETKELPLEWFLGQLP